MSTLTRGVRAGFWGCACGVVLGCGSLADDLPSLKELVAIGERDRAKVKAGELLYTVECQDVGDRFEEMVKEWKAQTHQSIARVQAREDIPPGPKEAWQRNLRESLTSARLQTLVSHTCQFGTFRMRLRFDREHEWTLSSKEDGRDLMGILEAAGAKDDGRFDLYPRIQRLCKKDWVATVYDLCRGGQMADIMVLPPGRLGAERILRLGFFTTDQVPSAEKYRCEISRSKKNKDLLMVEFKRWLRRHRLVYALDGSKGYRVTSFQEYQGRELARSQEFTYMPVDGMPFLKTYTCIDYDRKGKEIKRSKWTVEACRLARELPEGAFFLDLKEDTSVFDSKLGRFVHGPPDVVGEGHPFDPELEEKLRILGLDEVHEHGPWQEHPAGKPQAP